VLVHHVSVELVFVEETLAAYLTDTRLLVIRQMDSQKVILKSKKNLSFNCLKFFFIDPEKRKKV
jgi:hypothetical protein